MKTAFFAPMRFTGSATYVLRVKSNSVSENLPFPSTGAVVTDADYYASGDGQTGTESTGDGRRDLLAVLQACIRGHTHCASATVTLVDGRVTITNATSVQLVWADAATTLDAYAPDFGWTGIVNSADASPLTAPYPPRGLLQFGRLPTIDSRDRQPITVGHARALSGLRRASALVLPSKERDIAWDYLTQNLALTEYTSDGWSSVEWLWLNKLAPGSLVRVYDDDDNLSAGASAYKLYSARELEDPLERNERNPLFWRAAFKLALELDP